MAIGHKNNFKEKCMKNSGKLVTTALVFLMLLVPAFVFAEGGVEEPAQWLQTERTFSCGG